MKKKNLDSYFNAAKELPLSTSLSEVEKLVRLKGVSTVPPKKWWWNLNNLIIMTTTTALITLASLYVLSPTKASTYKSVDLKVSEIQFEQSDELIMPNVFLLPNASETSNQREDASIIASSHEEMKINLDPTWKEANLPIPMEEMGEIVSIDGDSSRNIDQEQAVVYSKTDSIDENLETDSRIKEIEKSISSKGVNTFKLKNSKGDIRIHNWDKEEIKLVAKVKVKTKKKENESIALEDFDLSLEKWSGDVTVESNWEDIYSCMCSGNSKKDQVKTASGEKVRVKALKLEYDVYLPNNIDLDLSNSYADISLPDWNANLKVRVFHAELKGGDVKKLEVSNSYGKIELGDFTELSGKTFQGEMTVGNGSKVDLGANYSKLFIGKVNQVDLAAFQSDAKFEGISETLETNFRYGKLEIQSSLQKADVRAFQSKVYAKDIDELEMNFSYGRIEAGNVKDLKFQNAFQSNIELQAVGSVVGSLKYTPFKATSLSDKLELTTFQSKVAIEEINPQFSLIKMIAKYTDLDLKLGGESSYKMKLVSNYASLELPEFSQLQSKENSSRREITTVHNPQSNGEASSSVDLNLFQGSLKLSN